MSALRFFVLTILFPFLPVLNAEAHFGMLIPSTPTVLSGEEAEVTLSLKFWHPFENKGMDLEKPTAFGVRRDGSDLNLLDTLNQRQEQGSTVWEGTYKVTRPGSHVFWMQPVPYFEKEEDCFIVHYTKAYLDAFGDSDGWDEPLGLKTEIVPLTEPGRLYAGNLFQGLILLDGKPVPHGEVEVEWYPGSGQRGVAPLKTMITQTLRADANGFFSYVAPVAGWWGFAALNTSEETLPYDGEDKEVELGAVLWVHFHPFLSPEALTE